MEDQKPHFLLVTMAAQGHINPTLQLAERLLQAGSHVTLCTPISLINSMNNATIPKGLAIVGFSDGYDDGFQLTKGVAFETYLSKLKQGGVERLTTFFSKSHVTCLVYTILLPWASEVAREFNVPSALLWIQPAMVFDIFYYYFHGYKDAIDDCEKDPSWSLQLPNSPFKLKASDLPTFFLSCNTFTYALTIYQEQFEEVEKQDIQKILVNTYHELESDALGSTGKIQLIPVGPLLPSAFLDRKKCSLSRVDHYYMEWLNSQEKSTVIYISFGSITVLSKPQIEELARALLETQRPFLWVIRKKEKQVDDDDEVSSIEELKKQGMIVPWCSQVEVLSHPSIGCFVTHFGWNSTLESLTCGVPMVGFPQWNDQTTNGKLVEDVWKTGVRVKASSEENELVKSEEIKRCLELVMKSEEIKENVKRYRNLAVQATKEGGSSHNNLKAFVKEVADYHHRGNCERS